MNMKCISIDAAYENKECNPYSTDYDATITWTDEYGEKLATGYFTVECTQTLESDWCKRRVCMNDLAFMTQSTRLFMFRNYLNRDAYGHTKYVQDQSTHVWKEVSNEDFDLISQCNNNFKGNGPIDTTGLKCCGDYPDRTLYNPLDTTTQCCVYKGIHHFSTSYESVAFDRTQILDYTFPRNIGKIYNQHEQICTEFGVAG